uniref:NADH dehydrogenase [ubiquinone] 1 beta subcomplex subunit 11, mitochondrial n=1 Tax=Angiostrongylus cantonensis TaxID=6313 RepID=A0A0K0D0N8_ANGCA
MRCALATVTPGESKVQLQKPEGESGFFKYGRNLSRNPKLKGVPKPQPGDTLASFMFRRLGHAYEVYPLFFLAGFWVVISCATIYYSFTKIEVWLDRSKSYSPSDWERARDNYWRKGTLAFDFEGRTRQRCELMEILQDEMLEAAKKRGTR